MPTVATFDDAKVFGTCWAEFVDRFYTGCSEFANREQTLSDWHEKTGGWVPAKAKERLTNALNALMPQYYEQFSPGDGMRVTSEAWLENDMFVGRLDGLGDKLVHEVKSTSRCPMISEQLWKVQNSLQVKLYCVLAEAEQVVIEFAFKDQPYSLYRGPLHPVTAEQRAGWKTELESLARLVQSLGTDEHNYPCHPDGCCITSARMVSMCPYQLLCDQGLTDETRTFYKERALRLADPVKPV